MESNMGVGVSIVLHREGAVMTGISRGEAPWTRTALAGMNSEAVEGQGESHVVTLRSSRIGSE